MPWAAVGAAALGGSGVVGSWLNRKSQKENLAWQKWAQKKTWQREDTAVQRSAEDFEKAGFNRILATGSKASTGPVVRTEAPQIDTDVSQIMSAIKMKQDISATEVQKEMWRNQGMQAKENALLAKEKAKTEKHNRGVAGPLPTNPGIVGRGFRDIGLMIQGYVDHLKKQGSAEVRKVKQQNGAQLLQNIFGGPK